MSSATSLAKIEALVDRVASDLRGMIRESLLRLLPGQDDEEARESSKAVVAGLAAEARETQADEGDEKAEAAEEQVAEYLDRIEDRLERTVSTPKQALSLLDQMSFEAQELARQLAEGGHLSLQQYRAMGGTARQAMGELEEAGLLVPLAGKGPDDRTIPVYWFPPSIGLKMRGVVQLLQPAPKDTRTFIEMGLRGVAYRTFRSPERGDQNEVVDIDDVVEPLDDSDADGLGSE